LNPLPVTLHPLSSPTQAAGNSFLSFFLPYILITMSLTGGLSAALDSSAGERERKTLESLLLTPAPRGQILIGKILAVSLISLTAVLVLRDAIVHNALSWSPLIVTSASLILTGGLCFYAALRLFTREALLVRS